MILVITYDYHYFMLGVRAVPQCQDEVVLVTGILW
jgi:hypothetical protein